MHVYGPYVWCMHTVPVYGPDFRSQKMSIYIIRVRVLGTDYGSSWVRELTWALVRVVNCSRRRRIRTETEREPRQF